MLPGLDVATAWQPQLRVLVVHEQYMTLVHQYEVRHKMLRWRGRLVYPAQLRTGVYPREHVLTVRTLNRIERLY